MLFSRGSNVRPVLAVLGRVLYVPFKLYSYMSATLNVNFSSLGRGFVPKQSSAACLLLALHVSPSCSLDTENRSDL